MRLLARLDARETADARLLPLPAPKGERGERGGGGTKTESGRSWRERKTSEKSRVERSRATSFRSIRGEDLLVICKGREMEGEG